MATGGNDMWPPSWGFPAASKFHNPPIHTWIPSWSSHSRYFRKLALACAVRCAGVSVPGLEWNGDTSYAEMLNAGSAVASVGNVTAVNGPPRARFNTSDASVRMFIRHWVGSENGLVLI